VDGRVGLRIKASSALDLRREALEERLRFAIHAHRPSQTPSRLCVNVEQRLQQ
jgi:hypothetical protein